MTSRVYGSCPLTTRSLAGAAREVPTVPGRGPVWTTGPRPVRAGASVRQEPSDLAEPLTGVWLPRMASSMAR